MAITVVIVEDFDMYRKALQKLLAAQSHIHLIAALRDGQEALEFLQETQPEVLVLDWVMPGIHGGALISEVVTRWPEVKVVVLSMHADEVYVRAAVESGASGYLLKEDAGTYLVKAIEQVALHRLPVFSPTVQAQMNGTQES